jgi:single-stranded-DNA-specific exonuclease
MTLKSKKNWILPESVPDELMNTVYKGMSNLKAQLLFNYGLLDETKISQYLDPQLKNIPSSELLFDIKSAVKVIANIIENDEKIYIHGDFDVDGICATSILWEFLHYELPTKINKKVNALPYIPDRVDEGYGLSESSLQAMIEGGVNLVISVDCGIRDKQLIQKYMSENSIQFLITDHHQPPDDLLESLNYPILHQLYPGHEYPFTQICGAFIAFSLVKELRKHFNILIENEEDTPGLDLVALATVSDMMPLVEVNRVILHYGIKQINQAKRIGLKQLVDTAGVKNGIVDSYHLGFVIGPRINAAGRIGSAMDALRLLVTDSQKNAIFYAQKLNKLNFERQSMTTSALENARTQALEMVEKNEKLIFTVSSGLHEGIVGLVAGKIQEEFGRPVIVTTQNNGETRGSARSIKGFNITDAISEFSKLLVKYGGHSQAAGFTVIEGKLDEFREKLMKFANKSIEDNALIQDSLIDLVAKVEDIDMTLYENIKGMQPFGYGNRKPNILIEKAVIIEKIALGQTGNHLKLKIKDNSFGIGEVLLFNADQDVKDLNIDDIISFIGTIDINEWNGNISVQFLVKEWKNVV